jgi:Predicted membrane protein
MGIIGWLILGLVAGAIARFVVPGRDPMGLGGTLLLGLAGSLLGGFLADLIFDDGAIGLFGSVVGAVIVLLAYNAWVRKERVA